MNAKDPFGLIGQTLDGQFRVEACIGEGGFSVVYRGTHLGLSEPVAVKCLKLPKGLPGQLVEPFLQRFRDESRILYKLSQGSLDIVRSVGAGNVVSNGSPVPYMVLEWLPGRSLAQELETRRHGGAQGISIDALIGLMSSAANAIGYAHSQGVIHRDLNPGNFFLVTAPSGIRLKVLDFGVAKLVSDHAIELGPRAPTMGQFKIFAPAYGAPEQFDERLGPMGPWTDVYSFAQVAVEVLRDRSALEGHSFAAFATATLDPARRPTPRAFGVPVADEVESIFFRALCINPRERYPDLGEFWRALTSAVTFAREHQVLSAAAAMPPLGLPLAQAATPARVLSRSFPEIPRVASQSEIHEPIGAMVESSTAVHSSGEIEALLARAVAAGFSVPNAKDTHVDPAPSDVFADTERAPEESAQLHAGAPKTLVDPPQPARRSGPREAAADPAHTLALGGGLGRGLGDAVRDSLRDPLNGRHSMYPALNADRSPSIKTEVAHQRTLALGGAQEPSGGEARRASAEMPIASRILAGMAGHRLLDRPVGEASDGESATGVSCASPKLVTQVGEASDGESATGDPSTAREFTAAGSVAGLAVAAVSSLAMSGKAGGSDNAAAPFPYGLPAPLTTTLAMHHDLGTGPYAPSNVIRATTVVPTPAAPQVEMGPVAMGLSTGGLPAGEASFAAPPAWGVANDGLAEPSRATPLSLARPPPSSVGLVVVAALALAGLGAGVWVYFAHTSARLTVVPSATAARAFESPAPLSSVSGTVIPQPSMVAVVGTTRTMPAPPEPTAKATPKESARPQASSVASSHATTVAAPPAPTVRPSAVRDPDEFDTKAAQTQLSTYGNMLAACKQKDGVHGKSAAQVGFAHDGSVASVTLEPPFVGSKQATCVTGLLRKATVPAFTKGNGSVRYAYEIP